MENPFAVVTLVESCGTTADCPSGTITLNLIRQMAEADRVDDHSFAVELTLKSTFFISFYGQTILYNVTVYLLSDFDGSYLGQRQTTSHW